MNGTPIKEKSKVKIRSFLGRIFSNGTTEEQPSAESSPIEGSPTINEISCPFNTVHRIHVGYDGQKFTGLPQSWLNILQRDISEADQKRNPKAVVTALKFYASSLNNQKEEKFMITKSIYPSDDDIGGTEFIVTKNGEVIRTSDGSDDMHIHRLDSSSTLDSARSSGSGPELLLKKETKICSIPSSNGSLSLPPKMDATSTADVPESLPILSSQEIIEHELGEDFPSPPSSPHLITANEQWNNQEPEDLLMEDFLVKCELEIPTKNTNEAINGEIAESQETSDAVFEEVCQKPEIGEETNEAAASSSTTVAAAISPPIPPARKMLQSKLSVERLFSACSPPPLSAAAEEKGCCDEKNVVAAASAPKPVRRVPPPLPPKPTKSELKSSRHSNGSRSRFNGDSGGPV